MISNTLNPSQFPSRHVLRSGGRFFTSRNFIFKAICLAIALVFGLNAVNAQQALLAAGGKATGSGGSVSYSVGQSVYMFNTGVNGSVTQGMQQSAPYAPPVLPTLSYSARHFTFHTGAAVSLTPTSSGVAAPAPGVYSSPVIVGSGLSNNAQGIALDAAGNIYVADHDAVNISVISADGSSITTIGDGSLFQPQSVAVDCNGNVYVADNQNIVEIPVDGSSPFTVGSGFVNPTGVAVDKAGNIYVADWGFGNGAVYKMANDGSGMVVIDNGLTGAYDIAVDSAANVYVIDAATKLLYKIPASGGPQVALTTTPFSAPVAVAVDGVGNIYVQDNATGQTYLVPPAGGTPVAIAAAIPASNGVAVDAAYNLYVTDANHDGVNKQSPTGGYFISAVLPAGLSFDSTTGIVSGTPSATASEKRYIITAYNADGGVSDTLRITVNGPVPVVSYTSPSSPYLAGTAITPLAPTASGVDAPGYAAPQLVAGDFLSPLGTAADEQGNVYVADKGNNLVKKINVDAGTSVSLGTGFDTPTGVAVDKAGNVYVADSGNGKVKKIPFNGDPVISIGTGFSAPAGVAVDDAGNVYVADLGNAAVYKIPAGGGAQITLAEDFDDLTGIAVDKHGNVYVSDGSAASVYRIAAKGGGAVDIGCNFNFPTGVAADAAGNVYVADGYGQLVYKIEGGRGNPVSTGFTYEFPGGVAVDQTGNLFVTDAALSVLYKVAPNGGYNLKTALPLGLRFNDTTGTVSGKPSAAAAAASYTVIAYNAGGGAPASFSLEVDLPPAPTLSYNTPNTYVAGTGAITPLTPTATGVGAPGYNSTPVTIASGFNQPGGTAVDAAGNIYFADSGNNKVMMLPFSGGPAVELGSGFQFPTGVAVDAAGNIYVADQGNGFVKKMPPGGGTPVCIGSGFSGPSAVAVDAAGNIYVADGSDGTVYKVSPDGTTVGLGGGFFNLTGIAVDGKENLYFTDGGDHAVYKVSLNGGIPFNIGCYFNYPSGIAVDNSGNIYVTDKTDNTLYRITKGGNKQVAIGMDFNAPAGVAVDAMGVVYIGDTGNNSIDKLLPSGGYFISATLPRGLKFNGTTGIISGTPSVVSAAKDYKVTAYSYGGSASATVNITVSLPPPPTLSYPTPLLYTKGKTIVPVAPTATGVAPPGYSTTLDVVDAGYNFPSSLATDKLGNIYVTDSGDDMVYKIPPGGSRVAIGSGFSQPLGVAVDNAGNVYVADSGNGVVKKIPAGSNIPVEIGSGFVFPAAVAVDAAGNLYIVDDAGCSCGSGASYVYKIAAGTGAMTTLSSDITSPGGITVDGSGNVYVSDLSTGNIFKLASGSYSLSQVGTYIFNTPYSLTIDGAGNIFVADAASGEIDEIPAAGGALIPVSAGFTIPYGIALDNNGNLLIADILSGNIDKLKPGGGYYISPVLPAGLSFDGTLGTISGTPTVVSPATDYTITAYNFGGGTQAVVNIKITFSSNALLTTFTTTPKIAMTIVPGTDYKDYQGIIYDSTSALSIIAVTQDPTATFTVNGVPGTSGTPSDPIQLNADTTTIYTTVTAGNGATKKTYAMKVTRQASNDAKLTSFALSPGTALTVVPGTDYRDYVATVKNSTSAISIIGITEDAAATFTVNGVPATSGTPSDPIHLNVDTNTIYATVTAGDGVTKKTYAIIVTRLPSNNAVLTSFTTTPKTALTVVPGTDYKDYTATVFNPASSISIIAVTQEATATITVNGRPATSGIPSDPVALNTDTTTIYTTVTAGDGVTKKTYAILITRQASNNAVLTSFTTTPKATLTAVPGTDYKDYAATVNSSTSSISIIAVTQDATATLTVNNVPATSGTPSGPVTLNADTTTIYTTVTAGDGVTKKTYAILVTRQLSDNAKLTTFTTTPKTTLTVVPGTNYKDYAATVDNSTSSISIFAVTQDAAATITVNGVPATSGNASAPVHLNVDTNTIYTTVTAGDGITKKTYALKVTRQTPPGFVMKYEAPAEMPVTGGEIVVHQNVSPNGDGRSDGLVIEGITAHPDNRLQVMSRSGVLIYDVKGYDNTTKVFDGHSSTSGKLQQAGTYFYSLEYKVGNETKRKTGFIVLKY